MKGKGTFVPLFAKLDGKLMEPETAAGFMFEPVGLPIKGERVSLERLNHWH